MEAVAMSGTAVDELCGPLDSWVAAGLISADQAERIIAAEAAGMVVVPTAGTVAAPAQTGGSARRRTPYVVEALGYLGAALAAIAGFLAVDQLWPDVPLGPQVGFAAAGAVLFAGAAMLIRTSAEPAAQRPAGAVDR
jgi:hypothetical protein